MKKTLLLFAGIVAALPTMAQGLSDGYITWPSAGDLATYVRAWNGGAGTITINGAAWEDENFFISRVKPKARFVNAATQIDPTLSLWSETNKSGKDKRLVWWVPISDASRAGVTTNALPNALYDQEAFSTWSYVDHYGNWTSPWGWVPGGFADVAHKNGVAVSGTSQPAWGSISAGWVAAFNDFISLDAATVGKFLLYHGVDGFGYNSEWSGYTPTGLTTMHKNLLSYMADKNPIFENIWYGGTGDDGNIHFDIGVKSFHDGIFKGSSIFLNYNWSGQSDSRNTEADSYSAAGQNPYKIYFGMDMQGGKPGSGNLDVLKNIRGSIGFWGAHSVNMLWQDRSASGSSPDAKQRAYINAIERWFTNGKRNPAINMPAAFIKNYRPTESTCGMSSLMSARSSLKWSLADEPFMSFFNLGNGKYLNYKGQRQHNHEWYNIGVQDYLPTWRWWFAPTYLGRNVNEANIHLAADFVWDDAWMGGSCLQVQGTTSEEFLHLFKTDFNIPNNTILTVRYKVLDGEGDINLAISAVGYESRLLNNADFGDIISLNLLEVAECSDAIDSEGWITKTIQFSSKAITNVKNALKGTATTAPNFNIAQIGLQFKNTKNLKVLLGELSLSKGTAKGLGSYGTPGAPVVSLSKLFKNNYQGVDGKVIWNMASTKNVGEPVYNTDVKTSLFRVYSQQEGCEPMTTGFASSWADIVYQAPYDNTLKGRIRFGVAALSLNFTEESAISWGEWLSVPSYTELDEIQLSKSTIKPNEDFEVSFVDPNHAAAAWKIVDVNDESKVYAEGNGLSLHCDGLPQIGFYHLDATYGGETHRYTRFIAISGTEVGALPEIYDLTVGGVDAAEIEGINIDLNESETFGYTGRDADGNLSRGIDLNEKWFGVNVGTLGIEAYQSFSVAAWVRYDEFPDDRANFITIENRAGSWPYNNWGFFWSRITKDGKFVHANIDTAWGHRIGGGTEGNRLFYRYDDAKIELSTWTHVCIVWEYNASKGLRQKFYINGEQMIASAWIAINKGTLEGKVGNDWRNLEAGFSSAIAYGTNQKEPGFATSAYPITTSDWIAFGGSAHEITATKGCVDDFQVWGKAMTDDEVKASMMGVDPNNLPADVLGFWDLEDESVTDYGFVGKTGANATNKAPKAYFYEMEKKDGEGQSTPTPKLAQSFLPGCPFVGGKAYPIVTKPTWNVRRATVDGSGTGVEGSANITFEKYGDYEVELVLENGHGKDSKTYPVVSVVDPNLAAIGDLNADADVKTYTVDKMLFVEFAADGLYNVEVYNAAGMLAANKTLKALAGNTATISLANAGVYVVKVVRDGKVLRTVKVINN